MVQSLHFYEPNREPNQNDNISFAILIYIGYILHYTQQPLILNQLLKVRMFLTQFLKKLTQNIYRGAHQLLYNQFVNTL